MAYKPRPVVLTTTGEGCIVPTSHKLNQDGYFRWYKPKEGYIMYHRYVWELYNEPIPAGYEINHKCKNRACCNISHLELLSGKEHAIETNKNRYKTRLDEAHEYWLSTQCRAVDMFERFGVTHSCAARWIRMWKV